MLFRSLIFAMLVVSAGSLISCSKEPEAVSPPALPAASGDMTGFLEAVHNTAIIGWAWNQRNPAETVSVDIYDGAQRLTTAKANNYRKDLEENKVGTGKYGFNFPMPANLKDGKSHQIRVLFAGTSTELKNSPKPYQMVQ